MLLRSHRRYRKNRRHTGGVSYFPDQLPTIYSFPPGDGTGLSVAVLEFGGGYVQTNLTAFFTSRGFPNVKPVQFVSVQGATNAPDGPNGAQAEVELDLEMIGCIVPNAQLICVMAPNSAAAFAAGIKQAVAMKVNAISLSWGGPENTWTASERAAVDAELQAANAAGIPFFVAAGDNGSSDGERGNNVDYPGSSPYSISCGGTSLQANTSTGAISSETVWNDGSQGGATGGGISEVYSQPSFQAQANTPSLSMRCVPDCAAVADPETGINVSIDGQAMVIGGTSAVAPMMAALALRLIQASGKPISTAQMQTLIYTAGTMRDITQGNNGTFTAKPGFDCCTGMGAPIGTAILNADAPTSTTPPTSAPTGPTNPTQPTQPTQPPAAVQITLSADLAAGTYTIAGANDAVIPKNIADMTVRELFENQH